MKVYSVQLDVSQGNKSLNLKRAKKLIEEHPIEPRSLIVLPEMFGTGFNLNLSETLSGEPSLTENFLGDLAISHESWVIGGMISPTSKEKMGANRALICDPFGNGIAHYDKMHLIPILGEEQVHIKGKCIEIINVGQFHVCPFICYDLRFPEIFRVAAGRGATLFIVLACWPDSRIEHWSSLLKARAIENQAYVVGVNATGSGSGMHYGGQSIVFDPKGNIVESTQKHECILESLLDLKELVEWRREFPALTQMQSDFLQKP